MSLAHTAIRALLVQHLAEQGSPVRVRHAGSLDTITDPVAIVAPATVTRSTLPRAWIDTETTVHVAVPLLDPDTAEDALAGALLDVLAALDSPAAEGIRWTTATRGTLAGDFSAWEITCTATLSREDHP